MSRTSVAHRAAAWIVLLAVLSCANDRSAPPDRPLEVEPQHSWTGEALLPNLQPSKSGRRTTAAVGAAFPASAQLAAALGASHVPDLAQRYAEAYGRVLVAHGYSWCVGPLTGFSGDARSDFAMAKKFAHGVAIGGMAFVGDARALDLTANESAAALLRQGIAGLALDAGQEHEELTRRVGFEFPHVVLPSLPSITAEPEPIRRGHLLHALAPQAHRIAGHETDAQHRRDVVTAQWRSVGREVARRSIVLVRDRAYRVPLGLDASWQVAGTPGSEELARLLAQSLAETGLELQPTEGARTIIAHDCRLRDSVDERTSALLESAEIVVMFGAIDRVPRVSKSATLLTTAGSTPDFVTSVAAALTGRATIDGRLHRDVENAGPRGTGITIAARESDLSIAKPESEGFRTDLEERVRAYVEDAIATRVFPACQIAIVRRDKLVLELALGHETYDEGSPRITRDHLFDLASVTKIVASTALAMHFYDRGRLKLDTRAQDLVPAFTDDVDGRKKRRVTLGMLLTHSAGLAPWKRLWKIAETPEAVLRAVYAEPLRFEPGSSYTYSDLGMILFGKCLEAIGAQPLDALANERIYRPLRMANTRFGPLPPELRVVPTEIEVGRGGVIRGRVHDENAEALGGVAGHAGLFSNARDLARFCRCLAAGGHLGSASLFSRQTVDHFCRRQEDVLETSRAIGFDTPTDGNSAGRRLSTQSVGHTGFTGTSLWIDRTRDLAVVCLTNRIHPSRNEPRIHAFRRGLHDLVVASLTSDPAPRRRRE